jgi:hypothetical protein
MNTITKALLIFCLFNQQLLAGKPKESSSNYNIRELALPSEVDNLPKKTGAIFHSPSVKGKVLIPVHFWGAVGKTGLHFVPLDTNLINGLSLAGGPRNDANLDNVRITSSREGVRKSFNFDLNEGGDLKLEDFKLRPGDTIFIQKDTFREERAYYTSLVGVVLTVLTSILLFREVRK